MKLHISEVALIVLVIVAIGVSVLGTSFTMIKLSNRDNLFIPTGQFTSTPTGTANVTIPSLTYISLPVATIDFGSLEVTETSDTSDGAPAPFQLQNDGTVNVNVTIGASDLFSSTGNPTSNYQFKSRINEADAVVNSTKDLITNYANMPVTGSPTRVVSNLKFPNAYDNVYIDINVTIPSDESAGAKGSIITLTATEA